MEVWALDIETRSLDSRMVDYAALQPWRTRQNKAEISSISVCDPDDNMTNLVNEGGDPRRWRKRVEDFLRKLKGKRVFGHFVPFDVAFLIGTCQPDKFKSIPQCVSNVLWADLATLVKWLINGQRAEESHFSYSLVNLVETFLQDHPLTGQFISMKSQNVIAGEDEDYWQSRGELDAIMTRALAQKLVEIVPKSMRVGLMTEWADIVPIANSWINGIRIDTGRIDEVDDAITSRMIHATKALDIEGTVLNSPRQLSRLLFDEWGLRPWSYTATKQPSTNADDLLLIQHDLSEDSILGKKLGLVVQYKSNSTLKSKYVKTLREALDHTGDGYIYGIPKLFGTYTGRMTYSSTTKQRKYKVSIALHQLPRIKSETKNANEVRMIRSLLLAPEGFGVIEDDASGQESRLMAIRSSDPVMIDIFKKKLNFHSLTAAAITGMDYTSFQAEFEKEKSGYYVEQRQLGKLTNLSCNYRMGGPALAKKAFTEYDTYMSDDMGRFLVQTFCRQYRQVPVYWKEVVARAVRDGYTECFGGRRYKIYRWDDKMRWTSESSAINMPIQGSGASMKEIALSVMTKKIPEAIFSLDLHDAMFSFAPVDQLDDVSEALLEVLNEIDYESFWGFEPCIPLPYESGTGLNFGEVK